MRIWLIHVGESLPTDPGGERQARMSLLARALADAGNQVLWWSSAFDHPYKRFRVAGEARLTAAPNLELFLLRGVGYRRNVSARRLLDHHLLARRFVALAPREPPPDLLVCSLPTVELAAAGVRYAASRGIPAVVDIRDLWPDIFLDLLPRPGRSLGRLALAPLFRATRDALRQATAIIAVSPGYLDWGLQRATRAPTPWDRVFPHGYPRLASRSPTPGRARERLITLGLEPGKRIVSFVGMLGRTYDLSTVIRAARMLHQRGRRDVQFAIAGSGDNADRWRLEASGVPSVVFTGWLTGEDIAELLSMTSIGIAAYAPGAPQTYPNKLFEYMHGGLPILSSLEGEAATLLQRHRCGMSYRAGDPGDLARLIEQLLDNEPLRADLARNSRQAFEGHYAADRVYADLTAHLLQIARNGRSDEANRSARNGSVTKDRLPLPRRRTGWLAFKDLAEITGVSLSREDAAMMYTRYSVAAQAAGGRRVLEIGCAEGQGLALVGRQARFLVGSDYCHPFLLRARSHYGGRYPLIQLSGDQLPLRDGAFDLVLCLEAYYYMPDTRASFQEIARVLTPGGLALFSSPNPERPDFIPSPSSVRYYSADEFRAAFSALGLDVTIEAAFPLQPIDQQGPWRLARRLFHTLGLLPRTLRGRRLLKRLAYGPLLPVPAELPQDFAPVAPRVAVDVGPLRGYKTLYVLARKPLSTG